MRNTYKTVLSGAAVAGLLWLLPAAELAAEPPSIRVAEIVKVYGDGKLLETYQAVSKGRMERDCYVFRVRRGVREPEVRVCGTFTVESVR